MAGSTTDTVMSPTGGGAECPLLIKLTLERYLECGKTFNCFLARIVTIAASSSDGRIIAAFHKWEHTGADKATRVVQVSAAGVVIGAI